MNTMLDDSEMDAISNDAAAKVAIVHTLKQIRTRPEVGWYLGSGSQVFSLLTKALAMMTGANVEELRAQFACPNAKNPAEEQEESKTGSSDDIADCERLLALMDEGSVEDFIEDLSEAGRMDIMRRLNHRFCASCGASYLVRFGACDCHQRRRNLAESIRANGGRQ